MFFPSSSFLHLFFMVWEKEARKWDWNFMPGRICCYFFLTLYASTSSNEAHKQNIIVRVARQALRLLVPRDCVVKRTVFTLPTRTRREFLRLLFSVCVELILIAKNVCNLFFEVVFYFFFSASGSFVCCCLLSGWLVDDGLGWMALAVIMFKYRNRLLKLQLLLLSS